MIRIENEKQANEGRFALELEKNIKEKDLEKN